MQVQLCDDIEQVDFVAELVEIEKRKIPQVPELRL